MNPTPVPAIILLVPPTAATWFRRVDRPLPAYKKPRLPRSAQPPIPVVDRKELRQRVARFLKQTERERDGLKAASLSCWALQ
jgi:hypothetical protein